MLAEIERLEPICRKPPADLYERAGACEQCHGAEGVPGVVCAHCELESQAVRWEAALFRFSARPVKAGAMVSEDDALEVYRAELMGGGRQGGAAPAQRTKTAIASVAMTHLDNEHSLLLQALVSLLRCGSALVLVACEKHTVNGAAAGTIALPRSEAVIQVRSLGTHFHPHLTPSTSLR